MVFYPLSLQSPFQITLCRLECAQAMVFDPLSLQYLRFRSLSVVLNALPPSCTSSRVSFLLATMPTTRDWRCRSFDLVQGGILISSPCWCTFTPWLLSKHGLIQPRMHEYHSRMTWEAWGSCRVWMREGRLSSGDGALLRACCPTHGLLILHTGRVRIARPDPSVDLVSFCGRTLTVALREKKWVPYEWCDLGAFIPGMTLFLNVPGRSAAPLIASESR
ncbi:hypothetical protein MUK42_03679 [Musa troglodytarum]|uniref:Uncharacterized protein n=1 Tax=Musa troglodytarum TaxID=320322 RepID=A0A9E7G5G9_9LILI|nr:hypothetical protein MUK42_03679 [Musa troglodytarum]